MNKGKQEGITLIALIITIIVMLILVATTVRIAVNSGLFGHAQNATKQWADTQRNEENISIDDYVSKIVGPTDIKSLDDILKKQIDSLSVGLTNAVKSKNLLELVESSCNELAGDTGMLHRIKELLENRKTASETNYTAIESEIDSLISEYNRIITETEYENKVLFNGSINEQNPYIVEFSNGYFEQGNMEIIIPDLSWETLYGSQEIDYNNLDEAIEKIDNMIKKINEEKSENGINKTNIGEKIEYLNNYINNLTSLHSTIFDTDMEETMKEYEKDPTNQELLEELSSGFYSPRHALRNAKSWETTIGLIRCTEGNLTTVANILLRMRDLGEQASTEVNTDEDRKLMKIEIDKSLKQIDDILKYSGAGNKKFFDGTFPCSEKVTLETLGIKNISLLTVEEANNSLNKIDNAIQKISDLRAKLGEKQNELEVIVNKEPHKEADKGYAFDL